MQVLAFCALSLVIIIGIFSLLTLFPPFHTFLPLPPFYQLERFLLPSSAVWGLLAELPGFASHVSGVYEGAGCR